MALKKKFFHLLSSGKSDGLKEVEWLRNNHLSSESYAPYIKTGIVNSWDYELVITATISKIADGRRAIIVGNYSGSRTINFELTGENKTRLYCQADTNVDPLHTLVDKYGPTVPENKPSKVWLKCTPLGDADHTINYEIGVEALDGSFSNKTTGSFYRYGSPESTKQLKLFYDYRGATASGFNGGFNMYQIEIKMGTAHKKFIPCLDDSNVPCMYEQIGKQLYYNEGTGSFSYGRRITEVEWIELTGQQWFDTGVYPNTLTTTVKATLEKTADSLATFPFGCRKQANLVDTCAIYFAGVTSDSPYGYIRLDWPMSAGNPRYNFTADTELIKMEITGNYAKVNDQEYTGTAVTSYTQTRTFHIGTCATGSAQFQSAYKGKFYMLDIKDDTIGFHRHCVPAHDENNVGFFFDRVNHYIIDNVGGSTSSMTWGNEIHPVEYLYGGYPNRYNTGIVCYDHKWETDVRYDAERPYYNLMGAATGAANYWGMVRSDSDVGTYTVHTSVSTFSLSIDPTTTRTVFVETGRNEANTADFISMTVEGENKQRTTTSANTQTGYRLLAISGGSSYLGEVYVYGNRCYDRTSNKLLQNLIPVQNENKVGYFLDTLSHVLIANDEVEDTTEKGAGQIGYSLEPELPYGMTRLNYIESTGTQYINTGIVPTITMGISVDYAYPTISSSTNAGVCGTYQGTSPRTDAFFLSTVSGKTDSNILLALAGQAINTAITPTANTWYNAKINWLNDGLMSVNDGTTYSVGTNGVESDTLTIFGRTLASDGSVEPSETRIRRFRISDGDKITHDLIPVKRTYDNRIGMFDLIGRQFYVIMLSPNSVLVSSASGEIEASSVSSSKLTYIDGLTSNAEETSNKTTTINSSSTDTQYPSAKAVYDLINN